jgi:L-ribulose-5-phosphate 4-epimerase
MMETIKQELIFWGRMLYERGLLCGSSGNISRRVEDKIFITAHGSYLGFLKEEDIVVLDVKGNLLEGKKGATSETPLHINVYQHFPEKTIVLHAHSPYTVHYFHQYTRLEPITFEERLYLGVIPVVPQHTPIVTKLEPVLEALEKNDIVVLQNHGVVAIGNDFKKVFSLIELLETNTKLALLTGRKPKEKMLKPVAYVLFSHKHLSALKERVNQDKEMQRLGEEYAFTTILGLLSEGKELSFFFEKGRIIKIKEEREKAAFVFSAKERMWRWVFKGEVDPFAAFFQGKIGLKGDFRQLMHWFPVFARLFTLWQEVGIL